MSVATLEKQELFWDIDPTILDTKAHARYIIERVVDFGNDNDVRWLWNSYPREQIAEVVAHSRSLRPKSKALWSLLTQNT